MLFMIYSEVSSLFSDENLYCFSFYIFLGVVGELKLKKVYGSSFSLVYFITFYFNICDSCKSLEKLINIKIIKVFTYFLSKF